MADSAPITDVLDKINALKATDPQQAIELLSELVRKHLSIIESTEAATQSTPSSSAPAVDIEEAIKSEEAYIMDLGKLLASEKRSSELEELIKSTRPFLTHVSRAKAAKLVRYLVDLYLDMEAKTGNELGLCKECVAWATTEKRTFLRQALQARQIALHYEVKEYQEGLVLVSSLLRELKKLDDKQLLVEVQLMESRIYHSLMNLSKARAALTSARTTANSIYVPTRVQAQLDLQSGILHAAAEKDFKTAYSYFYESFEGYDSLNNAKALDALNADEVASLVSGKLALKYAGRSVEAMKAIADAAHKRSLADFQKTLSDYQPELQGDPIVHSHLDTLYDDFLEANLLRIVELYSRVQISHIAATINLPKDKIERKLSQMILDTSLNGVLDQGNGVLIIFREGGCDGTYDNALDIIHEMSKAVDLLYAKAQKTARANEDYTEEEEEDAPDFGGHSMRGIGDDDDSSGSSETSIGDGDGSASLEDTAELPDEPEVVVHVARKLGLIGFDKRINLARK